MASVETVLRYRVYAVNDDAAEIEATVHSEDGSITFALSDQHGMVQVHLRDPEARKFVESILAVLPKETE